MTTPDRQPQTKLILKRVAENLFRADSSGVYYAICKVNRKQFRHNLQTTDRQLAERRVDAFRHKVDRLDTARAKKMQFAEYDSAGNLTGGLAKHWFDLSCLKWKPSVIARERYTVKGLHRYFGRSNIQKIDEEMVEQWATRRAAGVKPPTFNRERLRLIEIFAYATGKGWLLDNPAKTIPKRKVTKYVPRIPTKEQLARILAYMRSNAGKPDAKDSADLLEGLIYLGCRKEDAYWLEWQHVNLADNTPRAIRERLRSWQSSWRVSCTVKSGCPIRWQGRRENPLGLGAVLAGTMQ